MAPIGPQLPGPSQPRSPSYSSSQSSRSPSPPSPRRAVAGPQLPANFTRSRSNSVSSDDIGPSLPSSSSQPDSAGLNEGARLFLEREARRTAAAESARLAAEHAANSRPEWMLVPPSLANSSLQAVAGDPLNLKSRGFAQSTPRVSARASGSGTAEVDSSWTETPQQRMERMRAQVIGSHPSPAPDADELEHERTARRDAHIAAQVHDARQGKSLVEQHNDRRKRDMQRRLEDRNDSRRDRRHRDEKHSHRSSESRRDHDRHRHHRRDRSRSPRGRDEEKRHSRRDERDERDERHKDRKSSRSSRSGEKEERKSRKQREEDDVRAGKAAAPMLWDREAALSIGGRLMDEKKRGKLIADASALGDRFGSGSRRFL